MVTKIQRRPRAMCNFIPKSLNPRASKSGVREGLELSKGGGQQTGGKRGFSKGAVKESSLTPCLWGKPVSHDQSWDGGRLIRCKPSLRDNYFLVSINTGL
jgi:hypothetical protein